MEKLSVFITTFNNAHTLPFTLESVKWADEIVVLDSFSTDETMAITEQYGCKTAQHKFMGYGPQKQLALEMTSHNWVLLLDADEAPCPELQAEIQALMAEGPSKAGYTIARQEQLFWRMRTTKNRMNHFLRLFDKRNGGLDDIPIHAAPKVEGELGRLKHPFYHFGEIDIHTKVSKINSYAQGLVADKVAKGRKGNPWMMVFYPPFFFIRSYLFKRSFLNGWAGFIGSVIATFYVFLKYANLYEHYQFEKHGDSLLPKGAPSTVALREKGRKTV